MSKENMVINKAENNENNREKTKAEFVGGLNSTIHALVNYLKQSGIENSNTGIIINKDGVSVDGKMLTAEEAKARGIEVKQGEDGKVSVIGNIVSSGNINIGDLNSNATFDQSGQNVKNQYDLISNNESVTNQVVGNIIQGDNIGNVTNNNTESRAGTFTKVDNNDSNFPIPGTVANGTRVDLNEKGESVYTDTTRSNIDQQNKETKPAKERSTTLEKLKNATSDQEKISLAIEDKLENKGELVTKQPENALQNPNERKIKPLTRKEFRDGISQDRLAQFTADEINERRNNIHVKVDRYTGRTHMNYSIGDRIMNKFRDARAKIMEKINIASSNYDSPLRNAEVKSNQEVQYEDRGYELIEDGPNYHNELIDDNENYDEDDEEETLIAPDNIENIDQKEGLENKIDNQEAIKQTSDENKENLEPKELSSAEQLENLEKDIQNLEEEQSKLHSTNDQKRLERIKQSKNLRTSNPEYKSLVKKLSEEMAKDANAEHEIEELIKTKKGEKDELKEKIKNTPDQESEKEKNLDETIEDFKKDSYKLKNDLKDLENKNDILRASRVSMISTLTNNPTTENKAKIATLKLEGVKQRKAESDLNKKIDDLDDKIKNLENNKKEINDLNTKIKEGEDRLTIINDRILVLSNQNSSLAIDINKIDQQQDFIKEKNQINTDLLDLKKQIKTKESKIQNILDFYKNKPIQIEIE
jgi:hypothetical protein